MSTGLPLSEDVAKWLGLFGKVVEPPQTVNLKEFMAEENKQAFQSRYQKLTLLRDDILLYPNEYASDDITEIKRKVKEADANVTSLGELTTADKAEQALVAVDALEKEIKAGTAKFRAHDKEVRKYFAELKKLRPRIDLATNLPATGTGGVDTAWKAERQTFDTQLAKVVDVQNKKEFKKANEELTKLVPTIDALVNKKLAQVNTQVTDATGPTGSAEKAKDLVGELETTPGLIAAMSSEQQLKLLETLRTKIINCKACGKGMTKDEFVNNGNKCTSNKTPACAADQIEKPMRCTDCGNAVVGNCTYVCPSDKFNTYYDCTCNNNFKENGGVCPTCNDATNVSLDGEFCDLCGKPWSGGPTCDEPCDDSGKEIDDFVSANHNRDLLDARAKIMSKMKMDERFVEFDKKNRKTIAKELREFDDFKEAEGEWADWVSKGELVKIETVLKKVIEKQCKILGHDTFPGKVGPTVELVLQEPPDIEASNYGACEPGFPTRIKLNKKHAGFSDFKEVVDTIIHENSHAWQEMIMKKLKGEAPYTDIDKASIENNPDLVTQAKMFLENDQTYIQSEVDDDAYRHEPVEEHAWTAGGATSAMLLVPPAIQSFRSENIMQSKTWMVKSISREADATITLKERHGIYDNEWEGENPGDKKFVLEGPTIPGGKAEIEISSAPSENSLSSTFDASALPTPLIDPTRIKKELEDLSQQEFTKKLADLKPEEVTELHDKLVTDKKYEKVVGEKNVDFREPLTHKFIEVTACRLRLDERVAKLS